MSNIIRAETKYYKTGDNIWFTSDTHWGHKKIMEFCPHRPGNDIDEMGEELIKRWNSVVKPDDLVFHLGDFAFTNPAKYESILDRLNGQIILVYGNHDQIRCTKDRVLSKFKEIHAQILINIEGVSIYLSHFPLACWGGQHTQGTINLHGHIHSGPDSTSIDLQNFHEAPNQYDVGVDNNDYYPISWEQIKKKLNYAKNNETV